MGSTVSLIDVLKFSSEYLEKHNIESPRYNAEILITHILKLKRLDLYLNYERPVGIVEREEIKEMLKKRAKRIPVQYITGEEYFFGRRFSVNPAVLIPRPDTEILVEASIKYMQNCTKPMILDIGTGSGAIALTLGLELPQSKVLAVDISDKALETAKSNRTALGVSNVKIVKSDLFEKINYKEFDLIVSNPPYIPRNEYETLMPEVKDNEPVSALVAEDNGLFFYREISKKGRSYLKKGGRIAYEVGYNQAEAVCGILSNEGYKNIECINDLNGIKRVVTGERI